MYVYSASNNCFFEKERVQYYVSCGWSIDDAIEVDDSVFNEFSVSRPGFTRVAKDGLPSWIEVIISPEEVYNNSVTAFESYLKSRIDTLESSSELKLTPAKISVGLSSDEEISSLKNLISEIEMMKNALSSGEFISISEFQ